MMRVRNKIKPEIAYEKRDFVAGKGTTNTINIFRTLIEQALEIQKRNIQASLTTPRHLTEYDTMR